MARALRICPRDPYGPAGDGEGVPRDPRLGDHRTDINILRSEFADLRAKANEAEAKMAAFSELQELFPIKKCCISPFFLSTAR